MIFYYKNYIVDDFDFRIAWINNIYFRIILANFYYRN